MALILNLQLLACGDQKKLTPQDNPEAALAQRSGPAAIRILSFALRDAPPTREEAMDYAAGQMTQSELIANFVAAPAHQNRIGRFFHDAFGAHAFPDTIFGQKALILDANGWYQSSENHPQCSSVQQLQNLEVWWGSKGETAPVCSLAECGAFALNCGLVRHRGQLMDAIRYEFRDLGTFVYNEGLSWDDLYAGTFFYGNRLLLHKYLLDATIANGKAHAYLANADTLRSVLDQLFTVPLEQNVRLEFTAIGPERAGLVTSPAFMQRYNNFRSRVRALTVGLLCEDIGPWMNPSGLTHFINSDSLSSFDLSHSKQDNCASCHLGMDNWGSTLLGWSDQGQWQWWKTWSQSGAVQGIEGAGPKFLMSRLLHENQQFSSCMAQKAWQSFGQGRTWESLSRVDQNILLQAAEVNPQTLLRTLFGLESLTQSR